MGYKLWRDTPDNDAEQDCYCIDCGRYIDPNYSQHNGLCDYCNEKKYDTEEFDCCNKTR